MPSAAKRKSTVKSSAKAAAKRAARPIGARSPAKPAARPIAKSVPAKIAQAKLAAAKPLAKPMAKSVAKPIAKPLSKPLGKSVTPKVASPRQPGSFETKVLTALKRHGGAAVSFGQSPDHIKSAFKRCLAEGWVSGTVDSASLTEVGERVLERLKPEIRAFPAPTLRNRLNDALFRNQGNKAPAAPAAPANQDTIEAGSDEPEEEDEKTLPTAEDDEPETVDPEIEKAA
jgi:hypothetical protein